MVGVVSATIDHALRTALMYEYWRKGSLSRSAFTKWVDSQNPVDYGLNRDQLSLTTRFPSDEEGYVDRCLLALRDAGIISSIEYPKASFDACSIQIARTYKHGSYSTYIFPEEARLLYALAYIADGTRWAFLGSYYGYWAAWAMAGVFN